MSVVYKRTGRCWNQSYIIQLGMISTYRNVTVSSGRIDFAWQSLVGWVRIQIRIMNDWIDTSNQDATNYNPTSSNQTVRSYKIVRPNFWPEDRPMRAEIKISRLDYWFCYDTLDRSHNGDNILKLSYEHVFKIYKPVIYLIMVFWNIHRSMLIIEQ